MIGFNNNVQTFFSELHNSCLIILLSILLSFYLFLRLIYKIDG